MDHFRAENQEGSYIAGLTLPVINFSRKSIIGGSGIIFKKAARERGFDIQRTITHEMGHILGLGHEFARDAGGHLLHTSIMGYSGINFITERDEDMILGLYPID